MSKSWEISITVRDEQKKTSTISIHIQYHDEGVPSFSDFSEVEDVANYLLPLVDGMITGVIVRVSINREIPLIGGLKTSPSFVSDVEEKGVFVFLANFGGRKTISLPTFKDSLIINGSDEIDQSDSDVSLFIFALIDGSGTPLDFVGASTYRDERIFDLQSATEKFKSRKK